MKATKIIWDTDDDKETAASLPSEIEIPNELADDYDAIADYISDITGFCHRGYVIEK